MTEYREQEQELVELALGEITEPRRSELLGHLNGCTRCRATYDEIVSAVDLTVPAAPMSQPPAGFDLRVLAALGLEPGEQRTDDHKVIRVTPRRLVLAAAAAVLVIAGGVLGGVVALTGDEVPAAPAAGSVLRTGDGDRVGTAAVGWLHDERVLIVSVSDPVVGVGYRCRVLRAQEGPRTLGRWEASSSDGGVWVVPTPEGDLTGVQLVTDSGEVWSSAPLP